jgi:uncharacterized protein
MQEALKKLAENAEGLDLLVIFGSRARADSNANSDWDLGFIAQETFDANLWISQASLLLKTDKIDLVDLERASGLLRFRVSASNLI